MARPSNARPYNTTPILVSAIENAKHDRVGIMLETYEELKRLADLPEPKGMLIEFNSETAGQKHYKRMAAWAGEDGYDLFQRLQNKPHRYVYLRKQTEESDDAQS